MKKTLATLFILSGLFFSFISVQADEGLVPCGGEGQPACQLCHVFVMFDRIVDFVMLTLVPPLAALMLVISGVMFFTAGGDPNSLGKARSVLTSVALGLVIVYGSWLIINSFFVVIGVSEWTGLEKGWFSYPCLP